MLLPFPPIDQPGKSTPPFHYVLHLGKTSVNTTIIKQLHQILKAYFPNLREREVAIRSMVKEFHLTGSLVYRITSTHSLILRQDERGELPKRKHKDSPFPYLVNIELFSNSIGGWNEDLKRYGIKARARHLEPSTSSNSQIYLYDVTSITSRGNSYLRRQYSRLTHLRTDPIAYWNLSWDLIQKSWVFKLACLQNWKPRWYKELPLRELSRIWSQLEDIVKLKTLRGAIHNVWIESPKGKWRQLGVPSKPWRLYLHILNLFLSYQISHSLPRGEYEGFVYNRGCKSWWEDFLWGPYLRLYDTLVELDFSSGFPNLTLKGVEESLKSLQTIPTVITHLILQHLRSPLHSSSTFPTFETYVEHMCNLPWRQSERSVHMGLGISPILYVLSVKTAFSSFLPSFPFLQMKWYADDNVTLINLVGLLRYVLSHPWWSLSVLRSLAQNHFRLIPYLNSLTLFKQRGMKFCEKKSGLTRFFHIWLKPYRSLGLTLYTSLSKWQQLLNLILGKPTLLSLRSSTRGRGENPHKKKPSTPPRTEELSYGNGDMRLTLSSLLRHYRPYFGLLMSKLYGRGPNTPSVQPLTPRSLLWYLKIKRVNRHLIPSERLTLSNTSTKLSQVYLYTLTGKGVPPFLLSSELTSRLKVHWVQPSINLLDQTIPNPLEGSYPDPSSEFRKYSELRLSPEELERYRLAYSSLGKPMESNS